MARTTNKTARFTLPVRIRNKRKSSGDLSARMALIDRIADLPGIETVERNDEIFPPRVEICLRRDAADRVLKRKPLQLLCSLDCNGVFLSGLNRWERYQVLAKGWGKLVDDQVCVHLPRDSKELEIVWSVFHRAYVRLIGAATPESGSLVISTWDNPGGPLDKFGDSQSHHNALGQGERAQDWPSPIQASSTPPKGVVVRPAGSPSQGAYRC